MHFDFTQVHTATDRLEDAIHEVYKGAILDGSNDLCVKLPIMGVVDTIRSADTGVEVTTNTVFVEDKNGFSSPKIITLNEGIINKLTEESLVKLVRLVLTRNALDSDSLEDIERNQTIYWDKDDNELLLKETIAVSEEDEDEDVKVCDVGSAIDLEGIISSVKEELEDEPTITTIDKYYLEDLKRTPTIVSGTNNRYYRGIKHDDKTLGILLDKVAEIQDILDSSIKASGTMRVSSPTPAKRLNVRNVIIGNPNEYHSTKAFSGKRLHVTLVLDRSGSMHGTPAQDSAILMVALNNLAHKHKEFKASIVFSDSGHYNTMHFPVGEVNSIELLNFTEVHGAEGLAENMDKELELLESSDVVFVYTDGDIQAGNINKPMYTAKGIELTGLYTSDSKLGLKEYSMHYNKNKAWFHNVIVSNSTTDLAEHMCDYMTV